VPAMYERSIVHLNVVDFAVAVERMVDNRLTTRPVIIASRETARAAVYDMSEEAYQAGVRKGMQLHRAMRRCREAQILTPHPGLYERAMRALLKQALPYSPLIEPGDRDGHLFVDVTGTHRLFGPPVDVAWRLGRKIQRDLGLKPIWSVASNKLVAKVATRLVKPLGEYIVGAGEEEKILAPLPLKLIPGIERTDRLSLLEFNIVKASQVAALSLAQLEMVSGCRAGFLYEAVRGIDRSPVFSVGRKHPAIHVDQEFGEDTNEFPAVERVLYRLAEAAGHKLRRRHRAASRIRITIDYTDGIRCARQGTVTPPSADHRDLFAAARKSLLSAWGRRVRVRHIHFSVVRLVFPPAQLNLFPVDREKEKKTGDLVDAVDRIRARFGWKSVQMGRVLAGV